MNPFIRQCNALTSIIFISLLIAVSPQSRANKQTYDSALALTPEAEVGQYDWVVEPTSVGPDIPPVGRSLFDFLIRNSQADRKAYDIPFPFSALIEKIDQSLQVSEGESGIKKVLIPLGRSLQRPAAQKEFFIYPRAVTAVVSGPKLESRNAGLMLKDRMYIAYHEKSAVLEIISYNEAAGRFEFQLVKNYREAQQAEVYYARRAICMACHQNQSPIFSRPSWQETSANPMISEYLQATGKPYYGFALTHGVDIPNAIDEATERANLFSLQQWLWQQGCGLENNLKTISCRAALLNAVLQYRLSAGQYLDEYSVAYQQHVLQVIKQNWAKKWPNGVALPNPDIPNRDPFLRRVKSKELKPNQVDYMHVESVFEPINVRAPLDVWSELTPARLNILIKGLAGFLAEADIVRLDAQLKKLAGTADVPKIEQFQATCQLRNKRIKDKLRRINFSCEKPQSAPSGFATEGKLYVREATIERGEVSRFNVDSEQAYRHYLVQPAQDTNHASELSLIVNQSQARLSDGRRIESLTLDWHPPELNTQTYYSEALITVVDDYGPIRRALENLLKQTLDGHSNALSSQPFRRASILQALFKQLSIPPLEWCCEASENMPLAEVEHVSSAADQRGATGGLPSDFYKHCAQCHHTREQFPPNFLASDTDNIETKIGQCAERIYYRLSMWKLDKPLRPKTAMPPVLFLDRHGISVKDWQSSETIDGLLSYLEGVLGKQSSVKAGVADILNQNYEHLRPCLKESSLSAL